MDLERIVRNGFMAPGLRDLGIAGDAKLNPAPRNDPEEARFVVVMLADQLIETVSTIRRPIAMGLDDEASGGCLDLGSKDSGRMRRMK